MTQSDTTILNYGGGRQTVAICILIAKGIVPKPDRIVMADTGRENPMTWEYLNQHVQPMLAELGLSVEVAPHELATVDLYSGNGDLLLPVFTETGKLPGYCSNEWKARVVTRFIRGDASQGVRWLGLAFDEKRRWKSLHGKQEGKWRIECPLVDLMLNTDACMEIIRGHGLPAPHQSACWMCPNKQNAEWRTIKENHPDKWAEAVALDEEIRENDDRGGVYLHHSRKPLAEADLSENESREKVRQCSLGLCFV